MVGGLGEALHVSIDQKVQGHNLVDFSAYSTFKVPNALREINEKAYEPKVISIGPYHHGKGHLKAMEVHKMNALKLFLRRTGENSVEGYVTALERMEGEVREFYSEPLDIGTKELVEMMLLDGCFIIELIFNNTMEELLTDIYLRKAMRDLLLVENQLPLSVLSKLYSLRPGQQLNDAENCILEGGISFYKGMMPGCSINAPRRNRNVKHILGLLHDSSYSTPRPLPQAPPPLPQAPRRSQMQKRQFIRSATELNEAGIKFQKKRGKLFDIEYQNELMSDPTLIIPTLIIDDDKESILRNLVAYEQCYNGISSKCFAGYIIFMSCLINTGKDVELLCRCGVLDNWLGDHEVVVTMFNRLRDSILLSDEEFIYSDIFNRVNEYCNRRWSMHVANLRHNYFHTPSEAMQLQVAVLGFLLSSVLQTLYSILSYYHK